MNKKGVPVVEALFVVAILVIVIIVAIIVIAKELGDDSRKLFINDAKKVFVGAEKAYEKDGKFSADHSIYAKCVDGCNKVLDIDVKSDLEYFVKVDNQGNIVRFYVKDSQYQFKYEGKMKISDIKDVEDTTNYSNDRKINIANNNITNSIVYAEEFKYINSDIVFNIKDGLSKKVKTYDSFEKLSNSLSGNIYLRVKESDGIIEDVSIGFIKDKRAYYLSNNSSSEEIESLLSSLFGEKSCRKQESTPYFNKEVSKWVTPDDYDYSCFDKNMSITSWLIHDGKIKQVSVSENGYICDIYYDEVSCGMQN